MLCSRCIFYFTCASIYAAMTLRAQPWSRVLLWRRLLNSLVLPRRARHVFPSPPVLTPHSAHLHTPHTPHTVVTRRDYATEPRRVCWSCHRDLTKGNGEVEEGGSWPGVRFFCPCERRVVLPPTPGSNYFDTMNWYV